MSAGFLLETGSAEHPIAGPTPQVPLPPLLPHHPGSCPAPAALPSPYPTSIHLHIPSLSQTGVQIHKSDSLLPSQWALGPTDAFP